MKICVIGVGYVGLPLALRLSRKYAVIGYDRNKAKIANLQSGYDETGEFSDKDLNEAGVTFVDSDSDIHDCDIFIITVPTPVSNDRTPDLSYLIDASNLVGRHLDRGNMVIYESTVYPGATNEICVPVIEKMADLKLNDGFFVGYSPERVSPGQGGKRINEIEKIISASCSKKIPLMIEIYTAVTDKKLHVAPSIEVAEFAKVLENTQRDLNIALINEVSHICDRLKIKTRDVVNAAASKWNFAAYTPGFVGGHCIGVDPYYLLYKSEQLGYSAEVITAGRRVNERMTNFVVKKTIKTLSHFNKPVKECTVGVFGMTFKENCPDMRNSKCFDLVHQLSEYSLDVRCFDPYIHDEQAVVENIEITKHADRSEQLFDYIIIAVPHQQYVRLGANWFKERLSERNSKHIFDVKSLFPDEDFEAL